MKTSERNRRVAAIERVLPFFRLCPDDATVEVILEETAMIAVDEFERRAKLVLTRGNHHGNVIAELHRTWVDLAGGSG